VRELEIGTRESDRSGASCWTSVCKRFDGKLLRRVCTDLRLGTGWLAEPWLSLRGYDIVDQAWLHPKRQPLHTRSTPGGTSLGFPFSSRAIN
jgi:hypothetical protein